MSNDERLNRVEVKLQAAAEEYKSGKTNTRKAFGRVQRLARQKVMLTLAEG